MTDNVNRPAHYTSHPSGVECIQVTEHMGFNLGNAVKYIWRADLKGDAVEDLGKAVWYLQRELAKRRKAEKPCCWNLPGAEHHPMCKAGPDPVFADDDPCPGCADCEQLARGSK